MLQAQVDVLWEQLDAHFYDEGQYGAVPSQYDRDPFYSPAPVYLRQPVSYMRPLTNVLVLTNAYDSAGLPSLHPCPFLCFRRIYYEQSFCSTFP